MSDKATRPEIDEETMLRQIAHNTTMVKFVERYERRLAEQRAMIIARAAYFAKARKELE